MSFPDIWESVGVPDTTGVSTYLTVFGGAWQGRLGTEKRLKCMP